jgi:hypothetical protein
VRGARNALVGTVAILAIALPLVVVIADAALSWPSGGFYAAFAPTVIAFAAVGWLICVRRPDNVIGPLLLAFSLIFAVYFPIDLLVRLGSPAPAVQVAATFSAATDAPGFIVVAVTLILFPDGRLPGRGWRWVPIVAVVGIVSAMIGFTLNEGPLAAFPSVENPIAIPGFPGAIVGEVGYVCLVVLLVAAVGALVARWRRGGPTERAQVKWVGAAALVLLVAEAINLATFDVSDPFGSPAAIVLATVATALVPVSIGIAILRYRLYEIDRVISRTIGWAVVTGLLVAVFAGGVLALQALLAGFTQGQTLAVAASTLIAFALFQPVRRRVQRTVDHRFDRARYDGERTAAAFAERLRDEVDLETLATEFEQTAIRALHPTAASMWLPGGRVR